MAEGVHGFEQKETNGTERLILNLRVTNIFLKAVNFKNKSEKKPAVKFS